MFGNNYGACEVATDKPMQGHMTLKMRLNANLQEAEQRAADLKRVKEILDKNPDLEELLGILRRVNL